MQLSYDLSHFIGELYDEESAGFRFVPGGEVGLLSTCFGVQLCYLIDRLDLIDGIRTGSYIREHQLASGEFKDRQFNADDLQGRQTEKYLRWQFSFFALTALDMLGAPSRSPLMFLNEYLHEEGLRGWLGRLDFHDFWYGSNEIMFLLFFLSYTIKYGNDKEKPLKSANYILSSLDAKQRQVDGFWGEGADSGLANRMFGAAHIYIFYEFFQKTPRFVSAIVEKTLSLQVSNGLYHSYVGGACEDYDGVEILGRMLAFGGPREQICLSMEKTSQAILKAQAPNGGFPYQIPSLRPGVLYRRLTEKLKGEECYLFSGWNKMESNRYSPDLWATYFRMLSLANIERAANLPQHFPYVSYDLPAWGYLVSGKE